MTATQPHGDATQWWKTAAMHPRRGFALLATGCTLTLISVFVMEAFGLEPCPLCWLQRGAVAIALLGCIVGLLMPLRLKYWGIGVSALGLVIGLGLAARHLWLQSLPADEVPSCLPNMEYMLDVFPLWQVVLDILTADGDCAEIDWAPLGISIPGWMFVFCSGALVVLLDQVRPLFPVAEHPR